MSLLAAVLLSESNLIPLFSAVRIGSIEVMKLQSRSAPGHQEVVRDSRFLLRTTARTKDSKILITDTKPANHTNLFTCAFQTKRCTAVIGLKQIMHSKLLTNLIKREQESCVTNVLEPSAPPDWKETRRKV